MELGREIREIVRTETGIEDPYLEVKKLCNREATRQVDALRAKIEAEKDPLHLALTASITGNVIDYGSHERFDLAEKLRGISTQTPFSVDDRIELLQALDQARSIGFLADNAGEIVFDRILLETINWQLGPKKILFVVRAQPFINDALVADAKDAGIDTLPGLELREMDARIPEPGDSAWNVWQELTSCDVILSKGQANYEAFSSMSGIYFLLIIKCVLISNHLSERVGHPVECGDMILWRS